MTNPRPPESPFDPDEHAEAVPLADDIVVNIQGHTNDEIIDLVRQQLAERGINVDAALRPGARGEHEEEDHEEEDEEGEDEEEDEEGEDEEEEEHDSHHENADEKAKKADVAKRKTLGRIVTGTTAVAASVGAVAYAASVGTGSAVLKGTTIAAVNGSQLVLPAVAALIGAPLGLWALGHIRYQIMKAYHVKDLKEPVSIGDYVKEGWKLVLTPVGVIVNIPKAVGWSIGKVTHSFVTWGKSSGKGSGPAH